MKVVCIGGGPAGLYLGILLRRLDAAHEVHVFERNRADDTFGFGVVFSDATLHHLAAADPVTHAAIAAKFERWDDLEIHRVTAAGDELVRSTGHGFCGLERKALLAILHDRAAEVGVIIHTERALELPDAQALGADLIVACDGVASRARDHLGLAVGASVEVRPNRFVWLGTDLPLTAFTFWFIETELGWLRIHAYPFAPGRSTFIVECTEAAWRRGGFSVDDEAHTIATLERLCHAQLRGHRLIGNRSIWRNFPTVRCDRWDTGHTVLLGDAAHTAHFSIGSGTKLAMEDAIALAAALAAQPDDVPTALRAFDQARRPEVVALQAAAQHSLAWFERTEAFLDLPMAPFAYHLLTRSLRVSHRSMIQRDPELAWAVNQWASPDDTHPIGTRVWRHLDHDWPSRIALGTQDLTRVTGWWRGDHAPALPVPTVDPPDVLPLADGRRLRLTRIDTSLGPPAGALTASGDDALLAHLGPRLAALTTDAVLFCGEAALAWAELACSWKRRSGVRTAPAMGVALTGPRPPDIAAVFCAGRAEWVFVDALPLPTPTARA